MALNTPVQWATETAYWNAYPRGWDDARLYSIVCIPRDSSASIWDGDQVATVDDFGDLFVIADKVSLWGPVRTLRPRWPLTMTKGIWEEH